MNTTPALTTIDVTVLENVTGGAPKSQPQSGGFWNTVSGWASNLFGGGTNVNVNTGSGNNIGQGVSTKGNVTIGNNNGAPAPAK